MPYLSWTKDIISDVTTSSRAIKIWARWRARDLPMLMHVMEHVKIHRRSIHTHQKVHRMWRIGPRKGLVLCHCLFLMNVESFSTRNAILERQRPMAPSRQIFQPRGADYARKPLTLTTTKEDEEHETRRNPFQKATAKFKARPGTYLLIPCVAALVGWFTNYLAVQM